ncbi:MAG: PilZ domain-containing protein [Planctomycetota bacterium]|nr:MAG: PilZ domain-containing protein [Planctomycetota bacterium]
MARATPTADATETLPTGADRRRHPRRPFVRPCKVQRAGEVRAGAGETTNISAGGALIRVAGADRLRAGERVRVAVAWDAQGVVTTGSLLPARVVRVVPIDFHHQAVAVQYDRPLAESAPTAASADRPAAIAA